MPPGQVTVLVQRTPRSRLETEAMYGTLGMEHVELYSCGHIYFKVRQYPSERLRVKRKPESVGGSAVAHPSSNYRLRSH